jgi:transposase
MSRNHASARPAGARFERAIAVALVIGGKSQRAVAKVVGVAPKTVAAWVKAAREVGR